MRSLACLLLALAFICISARANARTWYIRADRNGDAPTIQAGIDSAQAGDDVLVAPGSYDELNQRRGMLESLFCMKSGVWVHSEGGPEVTFLNGSGVYMVVKCINVDDTAVIEGFRMSYASQYHPYFSHGGGAIYCESSSPVITGNRIVSNQSGIVCLDHSSPTITNNWIGDNTSEYAGGIYCHFESSPSISYNVIKDNYADMGGGVYCQAGCAPSITNNTFVGNSSPSGSGIYAGTAAIISRNIFAGQTGGPVLECLVSTQPQITCNAFWDNEGDMYACELDEDNISADPLFCDPEGGDYGLCSFSPCAAAYSRGCGLVGALGVSCDSCDPPDAICAVEPSELSFGWVEIGFSKILGFTISNQGFTTMTGTVGESCDYYTVLSGEGPYSLAPGESTTVTVLYEPTRPGTHICTIETGHPSCGAVSCTGDGAVTGTPNNSGKWALHYAGAHNSKANTCDFVLEGCGDLVVEGPADPGRYDVYVIAIDVDRIAATRYGLDCDGQFYFYGWMSCSSLEIPTEGWPGCGEGNAQSWSQEQPGPHVTIGILDVYVYEPSSLGVAPDPRTGWAEWCDGAVPSPVCRMTVSPEAFGSVGFGREGYDPSQEVPVIETTWGKVKAIYR